MSRDGNGKGGAPGIATDARTATGVDPRSGTTTAADTTPSDGGGDWDGLDGVRPAVREELCPGVGERTAIGALAPDVGGIVIPGVARGVGGEADTEAGGLPVARGASPAGPWCTASSATTDSAPAPISDQTAP